MIVRVESADSLGLDGEGMGSNEWQTVYRSTFGDDEPMACLFTAGVGTVIIGPSDKGDSSRLYEGGRGR